ncbi:histone-lysine N-methyltransferase [Trifolium repens]|nr:histone-lysine N-methyltransferase [Trifolium repens]
MKKLARKLRNSDHDDKFALPIHEDDDARPLDSQEQEELVRSFERNQAQQSRLWRTVFVTLLFCYILFLLYSIFRQASSPWELRHHAYFMEEIYSWVIISADWVAVLACSFAIQGLRHESMHHRRWIWYSWYTSIVLAIFWLNHMPRLPKFRWDVIWLPFGPLIASTICLYVDHLLIESSEEVKKLHGYMYAYKAS